MVGCWGFTTVLISTMMTVGVGHSRRYCNTGYDQSQSVSNQSIIQNLPTDHLREILSRNKTWSQTPNQPIRTIWLHLRAACQLSQFV